jgi:alkaline phosphatase D
MPITVNFPTLGPVIGHVNTTSARLWLRGGPGQQGIITYASTKDFFDAKKSTIQLNPNLDYSGTVYLPELTPGNRYYYMAGTVSDDLDINSLAISDFNWSAFKKHHKRQFFETDIEGVPASFLFGSCRHPGVWNLNRGDACFKAINKLQRRKSLNTKFIIMCGDQVYADVLHYEDHKPDIDDEIHEIKRDRHRHYFIAGKAKSSQEQYFQLYRNAWSNTEYRYLLSHTPTYMMMDDHEIINDWSPAFFEENSRYGNIPEILNWGLTAYQGYQAALAPIVAEPNRDELEPVKRRYYYKFSQGNCEFFVLDTRSKRQVSTQLGQEQLEELLAWINEPSEKIKFIVSPVPIFPDVQHFATPTLQQDTWSGFQQERLVILDNIYESKNRNIAFLSGDVHCSFIAELTCNKDPNFKIYNIVSSAFNWILPGLNRRNFIVDRPLATDNLHSPRANEAPEYQAKFVELDSTLFTGNVIVINNFCHIQVDNPEISGQIKKRITINYYTEKGNSLAKNKTIGIKTISL